MLARAGARVILIGREVHVQAINRDGLFLDTRNFQEQIRILASTDVAAVKNSRLVLLCVKTLDTEDAARALTPYLAGDAVLVSLQNGVDNVERIRRASEVEAIPAVVYVAAEMTGPGKVKHNGRGDLVIGDIGGTKNRNRLENVATIFEQAEVPCRISENIQAELWTKLIMNCAYNAISALGRARYGRIVDNPHGRELMRQVTEEVLAVGRAAGVQFPEGDVTEAVYQLGRAMANALSSTAQDLARGKRTEIDALNGYVARRGAELGIAAPINQTLFALVKLFEESISVSNNATII
jgi:2-dehydropantoate 2-reductase